MNDFSDIDRRLLAQLKLDGRASVTTLSGVLGLARGTIQTHLNRLVESGAIKRFTIELGEQDADDMVHAIMMIEVRGNTASQVQQALQRMAEVTSLHRTCGVWDMVVRLESSSLHEFDRVLNQIRELPGVSNSETCPLLRKVI